jgi:predicted Rossmann fold nucleotide-binding protein DprA/Smf involved in DNA uptake
VQEQDFKAVGYSQAAAQHLVALLQEEELLEHYLYRAKKVDCYPITRASANYPVAVRQRLGLESPGVLWAKGDSDLLELPRVSLVGSRDLQSDNAAFAAEVGRQTARQGYVLVSGNARGADKLAQNACLAAGGKVISVVADSLEEHKQKDNVLYLSEGGFEETFSAQRAISRNRVIHSLGSCAFVAQCGYQTGGTWDGTVKNLRFGWSNVYCFADGSPAGCLLAEMGAQTIEIEQLNDFASLPKPVAGLFEQENNT